MEPARTESPMVAQHKEALAAGQTRSLEAFWEAAVRAGTPLVEPLPEDGQHLLLTFLWRDAGHRTVVVAGPGLCPYRNQLELLPGTDLWYRTYRVRSDARFSYRLCPDDPLALTHGAEGRMAALRQDPLNRMPLHLPPFPPESCVSLPSSPPDE